MIKWLIRPEKAYDPALFRACRYMYLRNTSPNLLQNFEII